MAPVLAGCALFGSHDKSKDISLGIYEQVDEALPAENKQSVQIPHTDLKLTINPFPQLTERDVQSAELYDTVGGKAVFLRFDPHGTIVLDELTTRARGQYLTITINHRPVSAWLVDQRITNGQLLIEGDFTDEEAKTYVDNLNALSKKNNSP